MSSYRKKLIEVALPLDDINAACVREKSIRHGHPSTLHLWWARRPLAAARAVIFAQMVDDPGSIPDLNEEEVVQERERLFDIIRELVKWESSTNEEVLERARAEIKKSWVRTCKVTGDDPNTLPAFHDPFAGGGALPLEAQRLGLESYASDLNPVAVLINKAMIEIPPKFAGEPPINPASRKEKTLIAQKWRGVMGLAEDVRHYGQWMRDEAHKRIGHLYPKVTITEQMVVERPDLAPYAGQELTIIAWLWARTIKSPNPAFSHVDVPLVTTFMLGTKKGKEVHIKPVIRGEHYRFEIKCGKPQDPDTTKRGTKISRGANFNCLLSGTPIDSSHIKAEGKAGRIGTRLLAVVAKGQSGRVYFPPTDEMEALAKQAYSEWRPDVNLSGSTQYLGVKPYGIERVDELFTHRQTLSLTTFSDLVAEAHSRVLQDCATAGFKEAHSYADAVAVYLGLAVGRLADYSSTVCTWANNPQMEIVRGTFARQAIPMTWDFAEANPFGPSTGSFEIVLTWIYKVINKLPASMLGYARQHDATTRLDIPGGRLISTDPPYYDNVPYADLADFFYVWLRRAVGQYLPRLFATVSAPKANELVAFAYRHKDHDQAKAFFMNGMTEAMQQIRDATHNHLPVTIYYAFKQTENDKDGGSASTGWDTFLESVLRTGLGITGTWPVRTERAGRSREIGSSALASSIVLVCRKRPDDAPIATRQHFIRTLRAELPTALTNLQKSNIAPVDLAQSSIGPGMAIFSNYKKVIEADDSTMSVRSALQLINQVLDESLGAEEGALDGDTRFAVTWFETHQYNAGTFGEADNLARARNVSVLGVEEAGVLHSAAGKVRLYTRAELPDDWDPVTDKRLIVWEATQHLIKRLEQNGEQAAAELLQKLGPMAEQARNLAYRLYTTCERKKWAEEARAYNGLVIAWSDLEKLAGSTMSTSTPDTQVDLFE